MKNREIIESGQLELYALGALDSENTHKIAQLLSEDAELKSEYDAIVDALEQFGELNAVSAPSEILESAKKRIAEEEALEATEPKVQRLPNFRVWAIAASLFLVASLGLNLYLNGELSQLKSEYASLESENNQMANDNTLIRAQFDETRNLVAEISSGNMTNANLKSAGDYINFESVVFWDKQSSKVIIATKDLPELNENEQYQLWAIVDGKPTDAGLFNDTAGLFAMKNITGNVSAFAVTIEPKGGSENPTLEKMVMVGGLSNG